MRKWMSPATSADTSPRRRRMGISSAAAASGHGTVETHRQKASGSARYRVVGIKMHTF